MRIARYRSGIDQYHRLLAITTAADKCEHAVGGIAVLDPLEATGLMIEFMQGRIFPKEL